MLCGQSRVTGDSSEFRPVRIGREHVSSANRQSDAICGVGGLRRLILGLTALGIIGTTIELVFIRHWSSALRLLVWPALIALAIAAWAVARRPTPIGVRRARALSGVLLVVAALGVGAHVWANLEAALVDRDYESTWATLGREVYGDGSRRSLRRSDGRSG